MTLGNSDNGVRGETVQKTEEVRKGLWTGCSSSSYGRLRLEGSWSLAAVVPDASLEAGRVKVIYSSQGDVR